jgi:hypothetical protein
MINDEFVGGFYPPQYFSEFYPYESYLSKSFKLLERYVVETSINAVINFKTFRKTYHFGTVKWFRKRNFY